MDVKRLVLFSSLAVITYLMILQWNEDFSSVKEEPRQVEQLLDQQAPANSLGNDNLLPQIETKSSANTPLVSLPEASNNANLIQVTTPNYEISIDPKGGDLVFAALLNHKQKLKSEQPFVLLEKNYQVQSDLLGLNLNSRLNFASAANSYQLKNTEKQLEVVLTATTDELEINKIFTFYPDKHEIDVTYQVNNLSNESFSPSFYGLIKRDASADPTKNESLGMQAFLGGAFSTDDKRYQKIKFDDIAKKGLDVDSQGGWAAMLQHYFISAWIPNQQETSRFLTRADKNNAFYYVGFNGEAKNLAPQSQVELSAKVYLGPKIQKDMAAAAPNLDLTVDYGWLWFLAQPLFWLLNWIHSFLGNWGVAIICVTLLIKIAFYKLSATAYRSMANMRKLTPKLNQIKEECGDDRQKLSQRMMELYKKEKINPMGGCLPILVQMPVFIALYWMLMESVELRHAPFMFWIQDLSMKDPYFILPIIMGASMFVQQLLNPTPPDPMQAKLMKILPIAFTFFFLFFPSGLVLYWVVNNLLSILQQWLITRSIEKADAKTS